MALLTASAASAAALAWPPGAGLRRRRPAPAPPGAATPRAASTAAVQPVRVHCRCSCPFGPPTCLERSPDVRSCRLSRAIWRTAGRADGRSCPAPAPCAAGVAVVVVNGNLRHVHRLGAGRAGADRRLDVGRADASTRGGRKRERCPAIGWSCVRAAQRPPPHRRMLERAHVLHEAFSAVARLAAVSAAVAIPSPSARPDADVPAGADVATPDRG